MVGVRAATELIDVAAFEKLDPAERFVAGHHGESSLVLGDVALFAFNDGEPRVRREIVWFGVDELFPLVDQAGVDLAYKFAEPLDDVGDLLGLLAVGHGLVEGSVTVGEVAQHKACLLYTSPSPRDQRGSRMPSSA